MWCNGFAECADSCDELYATRPASPIEDCPIEDCPTGASQNPIGVKGADCVAQIAKGPESLTKVIPILGLILMALHVIWPLNLPGLRKRKDFWKIAVVMGVAIVFTALLRDHGSTSP